MAERDFVTERPPARPSRPPSGRDPRDPRARPPGDRRPPPPGRRSGPVPPRPPEPTIDSQAAFKGILIVLVTFVVGAFVFVQGLHRPEEEREATVPTSGLTSPSSAVTSVTSAAAPVPGDAPPATRVPPDQLALVVGNAVDPDKPVAGTVAAKLKSAGYTGNIRRMDVPRAADRSVVHYRAPEWREDALAVARALGIAEIDVSPLPNPPPLNASERNVFVIVGREPRGLSQP